MITNRDCSFFDGLQKPDITGLLAKWEQNGELLQRAMENFSDYVCAGEVLKFTLIADLGL